MAIYRKGQASMDADGYITGYGTNWKTALTLIRPGATIVFATNPVAYATISEIINDTSLRATSTGGAVVPQGDYVILLHDSITVDGLAQDVAETLRYYQGQETMYQGFVEFLKGFDWQKLEEIERNTKASESAAGASAKAAAQSESNANASKNAAAASATTASQQASAAASSASAAKTSENNAASSKTAAAKSASDAASSATTASQHKDAAAASASDAKTSETNANASKTAAESSASAAASSASSASGSATAAKTSETNAKTSETNAKKSETNAASSKTAAAASATTATQQADRAKTEADRAASANPDNQLKKANNLSDVADRRSAVNNLGLGWIDTSSGNSLLSSPDLSHRLVLGNDGLFVWQTSDGQTVPISVGAGGTGSTSPEGARANLQLDRFAQSGEQTFMYAQNKKMKIYVDDNGDWGAYDDTSGAIKPLPVNRGGTGAMNASGARNNFGLGEDQAVTFSQVISKQRNGSNGGILISDNLNSSGASVSQSRFYSEVQGGIRKTTIHTSGNGKNAYLQYDEDGNLTGINDIYARSINCNDSVNSAGWISANQGARVGLTTQSGGNKDIFLRNITGDGDNGSWVNLLQGNWYGGYWQIGGVRGGASDIDHFKIGVNNQGSDWKEFKFHNSYGGHITAQRGFKGQCVAGSWALDGDYMGAPFYADSVVANDGGYSPVVAGGTRSTGGYDLRYSFGAISGGTGDWPRPNIHMMGDGKYHRGFEFRVDGRITAWGTGTWGGSFEFQRVALSDRDLKKDIEYNDGKASFDNIMKFKPSTFVYKSDKYNRLRRGVIAQDLYEIDPEYVRIIPGSPIIDNSVEYDESGAAVIIDYKDDTLGLDNNVIMIDTALATRYIGGIVEKQQEEIDNLKADVEELKAIISKLIEK